MLGKPSPSGVFSATSSFLDLIGKWVLGTDLPNSQVNVDGTKFSVSYSASSKPLFGANGPSMSDVNQGYLGDCYLLSSLAEVASQNSGLISSMFTSNGNNTYGVKFYVNGVAEYVTVNNALADGGTVFNSGADIWASLAEKAYTQLQASGVVTGNSVNSGNSWTTTGNGGAPECALEEITGASQITDFMAAGATWYNVTYNSSLSMTGYTTNTTADCCSASPASRLRRWATTSLLSSRHQCVLHSSRQRNAGSPITRCRSMASTAPPASSRSEIPGAPRAARPGTRPSR